MVDAFTFTDEWGPARVLHIHRPALGLRAILVIDNTACGPAIGGIRMAPDVSLGECFRLARAMTWKNAAAGLPHGGGKSVIFGDPRMSVTRKEEIVRAFAASIADIADYIPGPDMGTDEQCMAWVHDETARAVGLPEAVGGIPLDEVGATGFGLVASVEAALPFIDLELRGARLAVQGFGAVGKHAARFLAGKGAVLIAASDSRGTIVDDNGLDVDRLVALKSSGLDLRAHDRGRKMHADAIVDVACDIWIPAARPDALHADNVQRFKARLVPQGANIPASDAAEQALHERGILVIPDFIANAGGVICASIEYRGGTRAAAFDYISERITANTRAVIEHSRRDRCTPRAAARALATERVRAAMTTRRWHAG